MIIYTAGTIDDKIFNLCNEKNIIIDNRLVSFYYQGEFNRYKQYQNNIGVINETEQK